jgi:hypothetical protein
LQQLIPRLICPTNPVRVDDDLGVCSMPEHCGEVFSLLSQISGMTAALLAAQFVFPALAALGGMLRGYQFPIATEVYLG